MPFSILLKMNRNNSLATMQKKWNTLNKLNKRLQYPQNKNLLKKKVDYFRKVALKKDFSMIIAIKHNKLAKIRIKHRY